MHNILIEQTKHSLLKKTVHKIDHKDFYRETAMLLYKTFLLNKSTFNILQYSIRYRILFSITHQNLPYTFRYHLISLFELNSDIFYKN